MLQRSRGFSLLEVIVALVLLAGTGVALFEWIGQNLRAAHRLQQHQASAQLTQNALALVQDVNPMLQPEGSLTAETFTVRWRSTPSQPAQPTQTAVPGVAGPWQVGLFRMQVEARDTRSGVETRFEWVQLGMQRQALGGPRTP